MGSSLPVFGIPVPPSLQHLSVSEKPVRGVDGQEDLAQMDGWGEIRAMSGLVETSFYAWRHHADTTNDLPAAGSARLSTAAAD